MCRNAMGLGLTVPLLDELTNNLHLQAPLFSFLTPSSIYDTLYSPS